MTHHLLGWISFLALEYIACLAIGLLVIAGFLAICYLVGAIVARVSDGEWPLGWEEPEYVIMRGFGTIAVIAVASVIGLGICKKL